MRKLAGTLFLALLGLPCASIAQDQAMEAGAAAGRSLGGLIGSIMNRQQTYDRAYQAEQDRMLREYAMIQQARRDQQEADAAILLKNVRAELEADWLKAGMDAEQAHAVASAYVFAPDDAAVFLSVRDVPFESVGASIRKAIGDRNFKLANQLLLGGLIEAKRRETQ
jgi:hypothetical protein